MDQATEDAAIKSAAGLPAYGQARTSNKLHKPGVFVSPSGVRSIWPRHDLAHFKSRLKALDALVAEDGGILTGAQVQALEKKKHDDKACCAIETAHLGYPGSQSTFWVGTLKGVKRVYQPTRIDTCAKIAHARLYTNSMPVTAADLFNDRVRPFHDEHDLTDAARKTANCQITPEPIHITKQKLNEKCPPI